MKILTQHLCMRLHVGAMKIKYPEIKGTKDYSSCKLFIIGSNHWICTCSQRPGVVQIIDSLALFYTLNKPTLLRVLQIYSYSSESSLKLQTMSAQQQEGSWHCGLFPIAMAMEVCCGNNPECASFHQEVICDHLIDCFERGKLSLFPKKLHKQLECIPRPFRHHHIIDLYCYCKMPED